MNVVDSSAWLEYFAGTKNAANFTKAIENTKSLIVPTITLQEVFKKLLREVGETEALKAVAHMRLGEVIDLDIELALRAASLSYEHKLPLADSIIFATAQEYNATLWTQDIDFKGLPGVKYFAKK